MPGARHGSINLPETMFAPTLPDKYATIAKLVVALVDNKISTEQAMELMFPEKEELEE
jgi:hypothetical protein